MQTPAAYLLSMPAGGGAAKNVTSDLHSEQYFLCVKVKSRKSRKKLAIPLVIRLCLNATYNYMQII